MAAVLRCGRLVPCKPSGGGWPLRKKRRAFALLERLRLCQLGYCAWPDLAAGSKRKPFQYQEDAPDGGLMDFLEGGAQTPPHVVVPNVPRATSRSSSAARFCGLRASSDLRFKEPAPVLGFNKVES
ncbi:hypothetical protein AK812_SmicGene10801 [Symbiodinium microadriaticum]|uniref:Uncharacterized protein n=1 Tax=Symbiodinium microadriaticum TaxID=2951 RepID=A0A1Q9EEW9_SYMMI|nr:hypothetical protein AK812_SmicGene10801 [Symbiodinium microadriaticum]